MPEKKRDDRKADGDRKNDPTVSQTLAEWFYRILLNLGLVISAPYYFRRMQRRGGWKAARRLALAPRPKAAAPKLNASRAQVKF